MQIAFEKENAGRSYPEMLLQQHKFIEDACGMFGNVYSMSLDKINEVKFFVYIELLDLSGIAYQIYLYL